MPHMSGEPGFISRSWTRLEGYGQRRAAALLFRRPFEIRSQRPIVSFTFDDFPRSALLAGGAILNRAGAVGTYYVSLGLAGQETPCGRAFELDDLRRAHDLGHELGCHTFGHYDAWRTPSRVFERSVADNQVALDRLLPGVRFQTCSYPISLPRPATKSRIANRFQCCRGGRQTFNSGTVDLNLLSAFFLEKTQNQIDPVKRVIDLNREARGWLILATHDVSENPTPLGCTPKFFENVVQYALDAGGHVLPVTTALELLTREARCDRIAQHASTGPDPALRSDSHAR